MNRKAENKLPQSIRDLIDRKLRQKQIELQDEWNSLKLHTYDQLKTELVEGIQNKKLIYAYTTVAISGYKTLTQDALNITRQWPLAVWETIKSILEINPGVLPKPQEIEAIIDNYTWHKEQEPFT